MHPARAMLLKTRSRSERRVHEANDEIYAHVAAKPPLANNAAYQEWRKDLDKLIRRLGPAWDDVHEILLQANITCGAYHGSANQFAVYTAIHSFKELMECSREWEEFDAVYPVVYWNGGHVMGIKGDTAYLVTKIAGKWCVGECDDPAEATIVVVEENRFVEGY